MLLGNTGCLEDVVFQLLLGAAGIHDQECHHEHALILALQFLQQILCIVSVGRQVTRNDIHVVTGADCLLLLFDLGAVQLCDRMLHRLDRLVLIKGTDMHRHDLAGFHIQQLLQQLIGKIRSRDSQKAHGSIQISHPEMSSAGEGEG